MVEEAARVLTSYEKTCADIEESRREQKGPFAVGTAESGASTATTRETRKNGLAGATSVLCHVRYGFRHRRQGYAKPLISPVMRETQG